MRSDLDQACEPDLAEDEAEHISAMKAHRYAGKKHKKGTECAACKTTENIEKAHLYPISEFALLLKPGEIPVVSLCGYHHKTFDYLATRYLKGWKDWRTERYYTDLEPPVQNVIENLVMSLEQKFFEIMKKHPIECDPFRMRTGGRWRVIYRIPTE